MNSASYACFGFENAPSLRLSPILRLELRQLSGRLLVGGRTESAGKLGFLRTQSKFAPWNAGGPTSQ